MHIQNTADTFQAPLFPTFSFSQHGSIPQGVKESIYPGRTYLLIEVFPNGQKLSRELLGRQIIRDYSSLFGNYIHGFIVREIGLDTPVLVYKGPIPKRVDEILSAH